MSGYLLFGETTPLVPDNFHWGIYIVPPSQPHVRGVSSLDHIRNKSSGWMADHNLIADVLNSSLLFSFIHIAYIPSRLESTWTEVSENTTINSITLRLPAELGFSVSCKSPLTAQWFLNAINLQALEREIKDWGNNNTQSAARINNLNRYMHLPFVVYR